MLVAADREHAGAVHDAACRPGARSRAVLDEQTVDLWPGKWPTSGSTLAVTFDRDHADRMRIEWDQQPAALDTLVASAAMPATPAAPAAPVTPVAGQPMVVLGANSDQAKQAIAAAEKMTGMDLDNDGTVAGAPAGPGQKLDIGALMAQAQAAMASMQQGGVFQVGGMPPRSRRCPRPRPARRTRSASSSASVPCAIAAR